MTRKRFATPRKLLAVERLNKRREKSAKKRKINNKIREQRRSV